jgi:hydroxyacylglutathione hydrolase
MRITPIACLSDNYAYLVISEEAREAAIVDASEAGPVVRAVLEANVRLVAIWSTHHHHDHVGGNEEVAARFEVKDVYAHASDRGRVPGQTRFLESGDSFTMGSLRVETIHIPGHTLGAIAYVVSDGTSAADGTSPALPERGQHLGGTSAVFTGDTLFLAGCGRLFEGTPAQMHSSLASLSGLGDDTHVYCGHEYTVNNLAFARYVEPSNTDVTRAAERASSHRAGHKPTVPGTLGEEKKTNPFLRASLPEIRASVGAPRDASDVEAFAAVRRAKDTFR